MKKTVVKRKWKLLQKAGKKLENETIFLLQYTIVVENSCSLLVLKNFLLLRRPPRRWFKLTFMPGIGKIRTTTKGRPCMSTILI